MLPSGICRKHMICHTLYTRSFISPLFLFCSVKTPNLYLAPFKSVEREQARGICYLLENPHVPAHKQRADPSNAARNRPGTSSRSGACAVGISSDAWRNQARKYQSTQPPAWRKARAGFLRDGQEKRCAALQPGSTTPQKRVSDIFQLWV